MKRGQGSGVFARHLPGGILSQVAYGAVSATADSDLPNGTLGAQAATLTSLLMLGNPETRAIAFVGNRPLPATLEIRQGHLATTSSAPTGGPPRNHRLADHRRTPAHSRIDSYARGMSRRRPAWLASLQPERSGVFG